MPLESEDTPGVVAVTSELSDDDWLSSGTLVNRSRSTSVWKVGSFSTRSPAPHSLPRYGLAGGGNLENQVQVGGDDGVDVDSSGAGVRIRSRRPRPCSLLKGTLGISKAPVGSVVAVRSSPLTGLVKWTVAPGITAPVGSVTVPWTGAELPFCAAKRRGRHEPDRRKPTEKNAKTWAVLQRHE